MYAGAWWLNNQCTRGSKYISWGWTKLLGHSSLRLAVYKCNMCTCLLPYLGTLPHSLVIMLMLIEVLYGAIRRWSVCYIVETQLSCSNMLIQWQSAQFSSLAGRFRDTLWSHLDCTDSDAMHTTLWKNHKTKDAQSTITVKSFIFVSRIVMFDVIC